MPYWRLLYHISWATYERRPLLTPERELLVNRIVQGKAAELGVFVHAFGATRDHIHLVASIPPKMRVSECIGQLKGASSHAVNRRAAPFRWQEGYGALSVCDEILPAVIVYVQRQKQHHQQGTLDMRFERDTEDDMLWQPMESTRARASTNSS